MRAAAVLLVGGRSTRMGQPKAELEWHGQPFADRIARVLLRATGGPLVVVAAPGQKLPRLPDEASVVVDAHEGRGPLEAIAAGLRALPEDAIAYVSSTDVPLLHPTLVERVIGAVDEQHDIAICESDGKLHPLAGAYRASLAPTIRELLDEGQRRPIALLERTRARVLDRAELLADESLAELDGGLGSLVNLNAPEDYAAAHARELPEIDVERFGVLRQEAAGVSALEHARAATLGQLADTLAIELDEHVVAALNGEQVTRDPWLPLVAGDRVSFLTADGGG